MCLISALWVEGGPVEEHLGGRDHRRSAEDAGAEPNEHGLHCDTRQKVDTYGHLIALHSAPRTLVQRHATHAKVERQN